MFGSLFYLWRFAGITVYADMSLFILLLIWLYPSLMPFDPAQAIDSLLLGVLLFASITMHEFGHSLTARRLGYEVHRIVLNILGGAAVLETSARKGSHEFLIAIAGPAVSVVIGFAGLFSWHLLYDIGMPGTASLIARLAVMNLYLAVFNLVPAFPLDGGRVFRSLLTPHLGLVRATAVAARVGQALAVFVGTYSLVGMFTKLAPFKLGVFSFEASPFLLMIAVYVYMAADAEYRMVLFESVQNRFRWSGFEYREGDGDGWKDGSRDISRDVEVGPAPFEHKRYKGIRGFFRRLFRK